VGYAKVGCYASQWNSRSPYPEDFCNIGFFETATLTRSSLSITTNSFLYSRQLWSTLSVRSPDSTDRQEIVEYDTPYSRTSV